MNLRRLTVLLPAVMLLLACHSQVDGTALTPTKQVGADGVDRALLKPGNYPTAPVPVPSEGYNRWILEGQRMSAYVVLPTDIDPALTDIAPLGTLPIKGASALALMLGQAGAKIAADNNFVVGFSSERLVEGDGPRPSLQILVMRFPDPAQAVAAATALNAGADMTQDKPREPFAVPRHPEALTSTWTAIDGSTHVASFAPHGTYVLHGRTSVRDGGADRGAELIAAALDRQAPRIDQFAPTELSKVRDLPVDPTGLVARTLQEPVGNATVVNGTYEPAGVLHYEDDPAAIGEVFAATGVDTIVLGRATVYRARDTAGATRMAEYLSSIEANRPGTTPGPAVEGMPNAKCFFRGVDPPGSLPRYRCVAVAANFAYTTSAQQDLDATQQTAAQYLMLSGEV